MARQVPPFEVRYVGMATRYRAISQDHQAFIEAQRLFFVATADADGRVNLSPKASDCLRVLGPNQIVWLNLTGSGNETAAHLAGLNRITMMFCSFAGKPLILRLYGTAKTILRHDSEWDSLSNRFPPRVGARQIFDVTVDLVQTSCGYQVPYFDYIGERDLLEKWENVKGSEGIETYWQSTNRPSLDGKPTGL